MNRLTYKLDEPIKTKYLNYEYNRIKDYDIDRCNFGRITDDMIFNKLGKLEDIEEELGIDLITLFEALKNGIYLKFGNEKITGVYYEHRTILPRHFDKDYKGYFIDLQLELSINFNFYFKDYGKTWALTKEELEND